MDNELDFPLYCSIHFKAGDIFPSVIDTIECTCLELYKMLKVAFVSLFFFGILWFDLYTLPV